ncbi:MAG TPA: hypothetical protein PLF50_00345 [Candidatus Cloacimonadota bacterium]|nr:hypothetical protein [Candidatus Cloacimonadota bacterium]HOV15946.1 hypothetical protein [Candidatus Cloacimonadota bacterium]HQL14259.1 hypothetical protein [Candidatus Cloacimonadota bacterium]
MTETKTEKKPVSNTLKSDFNLIELLSILLLVGLLFIFIVPVHQAKVSRTHITDAIATLKMIGDKAEEFKNNPDNGYYPDISQLNLGQKIESDYFTYSISPDDSLVIAETKPAFGKKGAYLVYSLTNKQFRVGKDDNDVTSSKYINDNWLP